MDQGTGASGHGHPSQDQARRALAEKQCRVAVTLNAVSARSVPGPGKVGRRGTEAAWRVALGGSSSAGPERRPASPLPSSPRFMWITPARIFYAGLLGRPSVRRLGAWAL